MPATSALLSPAGELELLREAAGEAGRIALRFFGRQPEVWMKTGDSPVTEADLAVDEYLRRTLTAARPDYGWLSEETIVEPGMSDAARVFVVDPIDGTRGFIQGLSTWCVSIAIVERGRPLAGVLDCPAKGRVYAAALGGGAWRDGARIEVAAPARPPRVGGPKKLVESAFEHEAVERTGYVPSLAYRLAMVAEGRLDATFVKPNSHDWDLAAADLILSEAGGGIRNRAGSAPNYATENPRHGILVAGSGRLLERLAAKLPDLDH